MKKLTLFDHDQVVAIDDGRQACGVICLANEARFTSANFSEPLTAYGVGWQDPDNLQQLIDALFPPVEAPRRFEFKSANNAQMFLSEADDVRAIGSAFKRLEFSGESVNAKTLNKGLTVRLDRDEMTDGAEERAVAVLRARLLRNDLRRGVALVIAAAHNTAKTWGSNADPDADVLDAIALGGDSRGMDADVVVYGAVAWQKRWKSYRAQNNAGAYASSQMSVDAVASQLGVGRGIISKARYQSSASAKSRILGNYVLSYAAPQGVSKDDPSNVKRFWTPTQAGVVAVYREEFPKFVDITVEHYSNIIITSSLGIEMLTIS